MYLGPETAIPLASALAGVIGLMLVSGRRGVTLVRALIRRLARARD